MNAAARQINQTSLFNGHFSDMHLSKQLCFQLALLVAVLCSALAVVYITNLHRVTSTQLGLAEKKSHQLELQWGQLLLEQASLATPARVQQLASDKLNMTLPVEKQTLVLRAPVR